MEIKNVLKRLVKLLFAAPLLTVSMMSQALESFDLAKEDTSAPVPTIDDKSDSETKQADYTLDLSATEEDGNSEETKDSDYTLEVSSNTDSDSDETEETQDANYQLQLSENDNTETDDSEDKEQNVTIS